MTSNPFLRNSLPSNSRTNASPLSPITNTRPVDAPLFMGLPLKYVSLIVLAVQNATLSIVMHYSRVSTSPSQSYSAASAVLLNEVFKGIISFCLALTNGRGSLQDRFRSSMNDVFSNDCWKLSIPAILYVIQNNLQYTAISNLSAATFQVAYQMKILTTALFSVILLHKTLSKTKWLSLVFLSIGVGIVQVQAGISQGGHSTASGVMYPTKGFMAVLAACFTSGLAGVYFEMVLKNSKTDLWIRNVQLSLFSLIPAFLPILLAENPTGSNPLSPSYLLRNFGPAAWATVAIQVFGGLVTAIVIKYSDNILKGFATSLAIIISFLASILLFNFPVTYSFLAGASVVLWATWMYNQPTDDSLGMGEPKKLYSPSVVTDRIDANAPILGHFVDEKGFSSKDDISVSIPRTFSFTSQPNPPSPRSLNASRTPSPHVT